jgi:predicted TIM-barrel fold metal-dependent hydrolase
VPDAVPADAFPRHDHEVAAFVRAVGAPGIVDVHVHLLPPRLQAAVWGYFDLLDDPPWPVTYRQDEGTRLATLRSLGVVAHTALAYAHRPGVAAWCNDHTLEAAERHAQVIPTFTFHPEDDVEGYVDAAIARGGRVAKVHLQVGRFHATDPRLTGVWRRLEVERIPAVVHASAVYGVDGGHEFCGPDALRALLDRHPDLRLVVAHLGMPDLDGFLDLVAAHPTVWMDTSMALTDPLYGDARFTPAQLERLAAHQDRLLFGSDFPTIPHRYVAQVRGLAALQLDERALRAVLHDRAAELLRVA